MTVEAITLIRSAISVLDQHTENPYFAGPWTAEGGNLYGTDPVSGHSGYAVAIGGDELGTGLSQEEALFIARTAGNPRFLHTVRIILNDALKALDQNRVTLADITDACRLADSILEPGALPQHTTTGA